MHQRYRICLIAPPNYVHASCFLEVALLLKSSFHDAGIECDMVPNQLAPDRTNIIVGGHLMQFGEYLLQYRYIPYQLEQLSAEEGPFSENLQLILQNAHQVWDYSQENIEFLANRGIKARHLPPGYHRLLERVPHSKDKEVDILFYGSAGPRRQSVLDRLGKPTLRLKTLFGVYGEERDRWIGASRLILNIHHYNTRIFEAVRLSYLLNNRCAILTETSDINPYPGVDIPTASYEKLVETCEELLRDIPALEHLAQSGYEKFRSRFEMTSLLRGVLEK